MFQACWKMRRNTTLSGESWFREFALEFADSMVKSTKVDLERLQACTLQRCNLQKLLESLKLELQKQSHLFQQTADFSVAMDVADITRRILKVQIGDDRKIGNKPTKSETR